MVNEFNNADIAYNDNEKIESDILSFNRVKRIFLMRICQKLLKMGSLEKNVINLTP